MVQYQARLSRTFAALSDPTRRAVLDRLGRGSATITELAGPAEMSLTGMKKHVRVLEEAKLVTTVKRGRERRCERAKEGLDEAAFWLEQYRRAQADRYDRLEEIIERKKRETS